MRRLVAAIAGIGLVVAGVGVAAVANQPAKAVQASTALSSFDPANIIDDAVMFNGSTMTAGQIQTFLEGKQPACGSRTTCLKGVTANMPALKQNPMCKALASRRNATAAQIIAAVAKACSVNPQVILVMLQKEQTLITGRTPYSGETVSSIYRKATGLGCPDTAACDPAKYGLFNQLYGVAYWLVRYTTPPGTTGPGWTNYSWFPVGKPNAVLYSPRGPVCGAKTITIRNKATASLYYYTPYQPNTAALSAGWGSGNSCSAYGNRNFYLYFTTWFGSTRYAVSGVLKTYWAAHSAQLGGPVTNATRTTASGGGTVQRFEKGTVYSSSAGTFAVTAPLLAKYTALGGPGGVLGWPRKAATVRGGTNGGTVQGFQKGSLYTSKAGTAVVTAPVMAEYGAAGYELGKLGWPTANAVRSTASGGATWQSFQGGRVVVTAKTSTVVPVPALSAWNGGGAGTGVLGWPTGDAKSVTAHGRKGTVQPFQTGMVTVQGAARNLSGDIWKNYLYHGGPTGVLGWTTGTSTTVALKGGGRTQRFANGIIYSSARGGVHAIANGSILDLYTVRGGVGGALGWPVAIRTSSKGTGGTAVVFQDGRIYRSTPGAFAVRGAILRHYLSKGASGSALGWPTSNATVVDGVTVQTFQHGRITWTRTGGAVASRS